MNVLIAFLAGLGIGSVGGYLLATHIHSIALDVASKIAQVGAPPPAQVVVAPQPQPTKTSGTLVSS